MYTISTACSSEQFELDEVNTNHQREMQDILSDAASKIKRFKEELASKQGQLNTEAQVSKGRKLSSSPVNSLHKHCTQTRVVLASVAHGLFAEPLLPAALLWRWRLCVFV